MTYNQLKNGWYIFIRSDCTIGVFTKQKNFEPQDKGIYFIRDIQCCFMEGIEDITKYKIVYLYDDEKESCPQKELDELMKNMSNKSIEFKTERYSNLDKNFILISKVHEKIKKRLAHALLHPVKLFVEFKKGREEEFNIIGHYPYRSNIESYTQWSKNMKFEIEPIIEHGKWLKPGFTEMSKQELIYNLEFNPDLTRKERKLIKKLIKKYEEEHLK